MASKNEYYLFLALIVALTFTVGCLGGGGVPYTDPVNWQDAIPSPLSVLRSASDDTCNGADFDPVHSALLVADGAQGSFYPSWVPGALPTDLAYGIYTLNADATPVMGTLTATWGHEPPGFEYWIGLGDLALDAWNWNDPLPGHSISGDITPFRAGDGSMLVAVVVLGTEMAVLNTLDLAQGTTTGPTADLVAVPTSGPPPLSVNFNGWTSDPGTGTIINYEWDLDGDGVFNEPLTVEEERHGMDSADYIYETEGVYHPALRVTNSEMQTDIGSVVINVSSGSTPGPENLFFLHHSTGHNIISAGVRDHVNSYNTANGTSYEFWDHCYTYCTALTGPDGSGTGTSYGGPCDNTDPDGLHDIWTSASPEHTATRNFILNNHGVIGFKSCFPASAIGSAAELQQRKDYYMAMRDVFDTRTDRLFIVMSTPPLRPEETNADDATRARAFADWLGSAEYLSGHPNVVCFDLFDELASDGSDGPADMLRESFCEPGGDSHPNATANTTVAPILADFFCDSASAYGWP